MSEPANTAPKPTVLSFNFHDATGASGIAADVEAIVSQGCHASTVITCLSVQDSQMVSSLIPIDDDIIIQSARAVLEDTPVVAIKIGLIGSEEGVQAIHEILLDYPDTPVIYDPMLVSSSGMELTEDEVIETSPQALNEVRNQIRKTLAMAQLKEAVKSLSAAVKQEAVITLQP